MKLSARQSASASATMQDLRWIAVAARDQSADGSFYYSVATTGVYCRPSCPSRTARPEHVRFHQTCEEAEQAGFRPCKRCKPDLPSAPDRHAALVASICRRIEAAETPPLLADLARQAGLSTYHFHRIFQRVTGLTPRAYAAAHRTQRLRNSLAQDTTVTEAIYAAGYGSNSRVYENIGNLLGMTPSDYRTGGAKARIRFALGQCSLGAILVASSARGVCAITLGDDPEVLVRELQDRFPKAELIGGDAEYETLVARVIGFIEQPALGLDLPLDIRGTAFQQRVWQALRDIPAGTTVNYSELARRIGIPKAVRAVASACAANTLAVAIPCHRVIRTDGALSGYRWGLARKQALLTRETDQTGKQEGGK